MGRKWMCATLNYLPANHHHGALDEKQLAIMPPTAGTRLRFKKVLSKKPFKKQKKVPSLKNRIRALERFLKRDNIDAETKSAKEKELDQLHQERDGKVQVEEEKKIAEKYKKPRFFERVKLMRKLKQAQSHMEKASDAKEKRKYEKEYEKHRQDLIYIYYFPKAEPYISLFPAKPLSENVLKRQAELRAAATKQFDEEQPLDAFHKFCYADGHAANSGAAALLAKKPTKEEEKKKKKPRNKKDKTEGGATSSKKSRVVADEDEVSDAEMAEGAGDEEEDDDFFL
ncbi:hypothetical protein Poli38472_009068 [Pythium oligandrum]|uniref:rRNA-processing protein EFG1 n=1 Tax=Pythium oligandrum TaxID=41045 RepID=A0A8K1CLI4_PYTOL|nr:hypothetical protein Poli38472_009068 [Pythium oligandrum]|eukprot:TMW64901.1 hypothetical protein Poli38472_009068 [Pythium oligandrum]